MAPRKAIIAVCALSMGTSMLSRAFNFYYVKVFLNKYHIEESWFHFSQLLYMFWNAINDPLFAILQDNTSFLITRTRREGVLYTAPLFAIAFLVPWFQFGTSSWAVGVHLTVSLFLYDTLFTFIGLLNCCLFTELSTDPHDRLKLTRYTTIASLVGVQSVFFLEFISDSLENFKAFQIGAVFLAVCSCLLMFYTGCHAHTEYDRHKMQADKDSEKRDCREPEASDGKIQDSKNEDSFLRKIWQLFSDVNFISFVITNFFQEFHRAFLSGFTAILGDYLISTDYVSADVRSFFYGLTGTCGGILVILGTPLIGRIGYFHAIRYNFVWKIFGGLTMYFFIGASNPWLLMLFLLLDTTFVNATFSLFNMPLSDIADDDKVKYKRKQPISSTVFGTNALVVKPSQSLSPMLVVSILNHYGYEQLKKSSTSTTETAQLKTVMFQMICFFPIILGVIQYMSWSLFTIRRKILHRTISDPV